MTVSLPDRGDGSRRRRRQEARHRPPRRFRPGRALLVLVALAAAAGAVWGVVALLGDDDEDGGPGAGTSTDAAGGPPPGLLVLEDGTGELVGVTIFHPATNAIVHVPPGTLLEVASIGLVSLREAATAGGAELVQHSLENLLGIRFGEAVTATPSSLLEGVPALLVRVAAPVEEVDGTGRVVEVVPSGTLSVDAESVEPLLLAVGRGTSLDRIVRHQAFWTARLDAGVPGPLDAVDALDATAQQRVLPVEAVTGADGDELYRVAAEDLAAMLRRLFPDAPTERIRVRILNGAGTPGIAQRVQPLLVDAGGLVALSGNADHFEYATTQVVYYDDDDRGAAEAVRDAIGVGEIVKSLTELAVVDVTVVVGADFEEADRGG